eukprot:13732768-Alexandrium_andersonii.AAC.1
MACSRRAPGLPIGALERTSARAMGKMLARTWFAPSLRVGGPRRTPREQRAQRSLASRPRRA